MGFSNSVAFSLLSLGAVLVDSLSLQIDSAQSIKSDSSAIAWQMMTNYYGNQTGNNPGNLPTPYYWWEAGGMFMHLVDYYYYTGDSTYNEETVQAMCWQAGTDGEFMPQNQTKDEGNDDQVFWAFAAMSAAELNFPPPQKDYPSWAAMAQAVFNLQTTRWDGTTCGGGMRWQITSLNNGWTYKNMASNGGFFQLASRLARYTGNQTYVHWAEKMWDWIDSSALVTQNGDVWKVYDGVSVDTCTKPNTAQYTYNYGILISGLAHLYNFTEDAKWLTPLYGLLNGTWETFTRGNKIIVEAGCEPYNNCNVDGLTFKSFLMRWLAVTTQLVPDSGNIIWPYIQASAEGAAGQCDGGDTGQVCGYHWTTSTWDGSDGVGQQMSALAAIDANMITVADLKPPLTLKTGATSKQNPSAGTGTQDQDGSSWATRKITTGDRAGAGIVTALILAFILAGTYWLLCVSTP